MLPSDNLLSLTGLGSIVFSYSDEYSDENLSNNEINSHLASDFEDAETQDDFAEFDDEQDLYGDYDSDEDSSDLPL